MPRDSELPAPNGAPGVSDTTGKSVRPGDWLKVGAIAAASAVLGGVAAAWFYRKTLSQLREAEERIPDSEFLATGDGSPEDF
jgi:hypothetical protein